MGIDIYRVFYKLSNRNNFQHKENQPNQTALALKKKRRGNVYVENNMS